MLTNPLVWLCLIYTPAVAVLTIASGVSSTRLPWAAMNRPGSDPDRAKPNQDAHFQVELDDGEAWLGLGVLDGHGKRGHIVAEYLAEHALPRTLAAQEGPTQEGLVAAFEQAHAEQSAEPKVDGRVSGAACILACVPEPSRASRLASGRASSLRRLLGCWWHRDGSDKSDR